jgi:hypothetical protein
MTTSSPVSPDEKRARWCREVRTITVVTEDHALPVPRLTLTRAEFGIFGAEAAVRRQLAAAETALGEALGVTFAARTETLGTGDTEWYLLEADLPSGMVLRIAALAALVAEKRVTGRTVTEITEWVRKPAADEEAAA